MEVVELETPEPLPVHAGASGLGTTAIQLGRTAVLVAG